MRLHVIACRVLTRELSFCCSQCPNTVDTTWLPQGLHDTPTILRNTIQQAMDDVLQQVECGRFKHRPDAFALGYGLCSNGVVGLQTKDIPLVVPRTDDCIALFLGSQQRYLESFQRYPGTYWLNNGWIETAFVPSPQEMERQHQEYIAKYGEENAEYLMEEMNTWITKYSHCGYISSPVYECSEHLALAQAVAKAHGLRFHKLDGNLDLLQKLLSGRWDEAEFLVCPPNHEICATYGPDKIKAIPLAGLPLL